MKKNIKNTVMSIFVILLLFTMAATPKIYEIYQEAESKKIEFEKEMDAIEQESANILEELNRLDTVTSDVYDNKVTVTEDVYGSSEIVEPIRIEQMRVSGKISDAKNLSFFDYSIHLDEPIIINEVSYDAVYIYENPEMRMYFDNSLFYFQGDEEYLIFNDDSPVNIELELTNIQDAKNGALFGNYSKTIVLSTNLELVDLSRTEYSLDYIENYLEYILEFDDNKNYLEGNDNREIRETILYDADPKFKALIDSYYEMGKKVYYNDSKEIYLVYKTQ